MGPILKIVLFFLILSHSLRASDLEAVDFMSRETTSWSEAVYIQIDNPQRDPPIEALPYPMRMIPKDVLKKHVIPLLELRGRRSLRETCVYFQKLVEEDHLFKIVMAIDLELKEKNLHQGSGNKGLSEYVAESIHLLNAIQRFPRFIDRAIKSSPYYKRIETLWLLRHLPGVDQEAVRRLCNYYGVRTKLNPYGDAIALQTDFHIRNYKLKLLTMLALPACVGLSLLWPIYQPAIWPYFKTPETPWVEFTTPPFQFIFQSVACDNRFPDDNCFNGAYFIDTQPANVSYTRANDYINHHHILNNLAVYHTGFNYTALPYVLGIGIPYGLLAIGNYIQTIRSRPMAHLDFLTIAQATKFCDRARGVLHKHAWKNRLWFGAKVLTTAGLATLVAFNIAHYCDFTYSIARLPALNYTNEVSDLLELYDGFYLKYVSYKARDLVDSCEIPGTEWLLYYYSTAFVKPEIYRNLSWMVHNDYLSWSTVPNMSNVPGLYGSLERVFSTLSKYKIITEDTPINILYNVYHKTTATRISENIFIQTGYWLPAFLPQILISLHIFYLLFIAIW